MFFLFSPGSSPLKHAKSQACGWRPLSSPLTNGKLGVPFPVVSYDSMSVIALSAKKQLSPSNSVASGSASAIIAVSPNHSHSQSSQSSNSRHGSAAIDQLEWGSIMLPKRQAQGYSNQVKTVAQHVHPVYRHWLSTAPTTILYYYSKTITI